MPAALTTSEQSRLTELCATVKKGLQTFVEVGTALMEIRESGLYKARCSTFEAFVQFEFGMSRAHAYRQIEAAEVVAGLSPMGDTTPDSERVARELTGTPPEQRPEVWQEAVRTAASEGRKVTAEHVKIAADARRGGTGKAPKYDKLANQRELREAKSSEGQSPASRSAGDDTSEEAGASGEPIHVAPDGGPILPADVAAAARKEWRESAIGRVRAYLGKIGPAPEFTSDEISDTAVQFTPGELMLFGFHHKLIGQILEAAGKEKLRVMR